jgi:hypothetical protein
VELLDCEYKPIPQIHKAAQDRRETNPQQKSAFGGHYKGA